MSGHPHIVQLRETFVTPEYLGIVMEYSWDMVPPPTDSLSLSGRTLYAALCLQPQHICYVHALLL